MPVKSEREYRKAGAFEARDAEEQEKSYIVEGYATTFNDPYVLFDDGETVIYEQIDAHAFDNAEMDDVIMQFDHEGRVFARKSNGSLELNCDEHGLHVRADLSATEGSRELYEEIRTGLIREMSFAFTVSAEEYNKNTRTRTITGIKRLYDVSAVSIPQNPATNISARTFADGVIRQEEAERLQKAAEETEIRRMRLRVMLQLNDGGKENGTV